MVYVCVRSHHPGGEVGGGAPDADGHRADRGHPGGRSGPPAPHVLLPPRPVRPQEEVSWGRVWGTVGETERGWGVGERD